MLHSFWYSAGEKLVPRRAREGSDLCASPPGASRRILMSNPLAGQGASAKGAEEAQAAIDQGRRIGAKTAARARLHRGGRRVLRRLGQPSRARAAGRRAPRPSRRSPRAIRPTTRRRSSPRSTSPARNPRPTRPTPRTSRQPRSSRSEFKKYPDHPGVAHYLIHSYDAPPIAEKGLVAARRYADHRAGRAARAAHAIAHLHARRRVGGVRRDQPALGRGRARRGNDPDEAYHARDYTVYAYLQLARDAEARAHHRRGDEGGRAPPRASSRPMRSRRCRRAMRWSAATGRSAARARSPPTTYPYVEAITYFARALGAARSGDVAAAREDAEQLAAAAAGARGGEEHVLGDRSRDPAPGVRPAGSRSAEGKTDEALKLMRASADLEDRNEKHIVTPGRIAARARAAGRDAARAEAARRGAEGVRGVAGSRTQPLPQLRAAARAGEGAGDTAKAAAYYEKLPRSRTIPTPTGPSW